MTLRSRLVLALGLAAILPTIVVVMVPLLSAGRRAAAETAGRIDSAGRQARVLLEDERADMTAAADRAAADLRADRDGLAAVLRGPEAVAGPVARALGERFGFDRVRIDASAGPVLAAWGAAAESPGVQVESRVIPAEGESLKLVVERELGERFLSRVASVTGGATRLAAGPAGVCGEAHAAVFVNDGVVLCVAVVPADAREVRGELLRAFAGTAVVALAASLLLGLVLAARIARPIRALAERAESISERHRGPLTFLPEEDETRRLTLAFDRMLDGLAASEEKRAAAERVAAWEEMARRLAHEVKNPLSPIQLAVENLKRAREKSPEAFERTFAAETSTILEEVASLRGLVDEFARFARLPRPETAPCDPKALVAGAIGLYAGRIESLGVRVVVDDAHAPSSVIADAEQLGRVLKNVIRNALDAMEHAADRTLSVTVRSEGSRAAFEIRDSGPGFEPAALARVFEPYFTTRPGSGGTGLGMAIAQRIVAEHGGTIRAGNAEKGGAVVTIVV